MKKWTRWQDWAAVAAGAVAALSTLWTTQTTSSTWLMVALGVLIAASGAVNLAAPDAPWIEWLQVVLGAALVVSPWAGSYTGHSGAAWTSWIAGAVVVVATGLAISPSTAAHHHAIPSH
ncbi:SPW repeat protein [Arthrobacter sp. SDTb3-6]|uniref:SPW repeat protein n=1 Tax=Arthrobacter sp. SDTb3-6 TaxID=2713571 RepID=UPI00159D5780|nr:SPW repeat protein [Arthrobacter sp. SDTb3-6]NVM99822.1 SPW repeat protein [Arthrobacter sp. SDTb3-6]